MNEKRSKPGCAAVFDCGAGNKYIQMQITLPATAMEGLREAAQSKGVSPNILLRMAAVELFDTARQDKEAKVYQLAVEQPAEIEAYCRAKRHRSVPDFALFAMEQSMARHPLSAAQKARVGKRRRGRRRGRLGITAQCLGGHFGGGAREQFSRVPPCLKGG
jgi:hypothetical protein